MVEPGKPAHKKIRNEFGEDFFLENGELDRNKMGDLIFKDVGKRVKLNRILHPAIYKAMTYEVIHNFFKGKHERQLTFIHKISGPKFLLQ